MVSTYVKPRDPMPFSDRDKNTHGRIGLLADTHLSSQNVVLSQYSPPAQGVDYDIWMQVFPQISGGLGEDAEFLSGYLGTKKDFVRISDATGRFPQQDVRLEQFASYVTQLSQRLKN